MDKPSGPTSHDVVARVRRACGIRAVGHTGTLDPFATGLLVLLVGPATRLARFVEADRKTYRAVARLGRRTTTDDLTGEPLGPESDPGGIGREAVAAALAGLTGRQLQRPPAFSAKHVAGERSYRLARRGEAPDLPPVEVTVHAAELLDLRLPDVEFRVTVSGGTYVRALARDLGERLGTGAHLVALRREAIGPLRVEDAVPLDALETPPALLSPLAVLPQLPVVELDPAARAAVGHGRAVPAPAGRDLHGPVALRHEGRLVAVARAEGDWLRPDVVLREAA